MRRLLPWMVLALWGCSGDKGPRGAVGANCWDLDGDGEEDASEDVNGDGEWTAADCAGEQGEQGERGERGDPGDAGPQGEEGQPGTACWDLDANGEPDDDEDVNGDEVVDALDCAGTQGIEGEQGLGCFDLNGDGVQDLAEDVNGDGFWDALDCAGASTGTIAGTIMDRDSGALLSGAAVTLQPIGLALATAADGTFLFEDLPFGVYTISASAPSLVLEGDEIVPDLPVELESEAMSLLAGQVVQVRLGLRRLEVDVMNLQMVHSGDFSGYTTENCETCHSNREAETSTLADQPPYHALDGHADLACTFCHSPDNGVDIATLSGWTFESASTFRKQVDIETCALCHECYPSSFCALGDCPDQCP